jgi:hypothetical protein
MRNLLLLLFIGGLIVTNLSAITIDYTLSNVAGNVYEYTYAISGSFNANEAIFIDFPTNSPSDSNVTIEDPPVSGFTATYQPGFGGGQPNDVEYMSQVNNPSLAGPFVVEFTYTGTGQPGAQNYDVNQYDSNLNLQQTVVVNGTTMIEADPVPEPSGLGLGAMALLVMGACWAVRRMRRPAPTPAE